MGSQGKDRLKVIPIIHLPNFRVLTWDEDFLYISREYTLFRINGREIGGNELKLEKVGAFKPDPVGRVACKNKILGRLLRTGFHAVRVLSNSKIVGTVAKNIVVLEPGGERFISTWRIKRGTRPIGLAVTHDGRIYWGEYFANPERDEVYVYGSEDGGGYTWEVVYAFPKKSIRHIHNIFYDPYGNSFWILTGDEEKEPRIIRASPDWRWMDVILQGNQQARAVTMILKKDEIFTLQILRMSRITYIVWRGRRERSRECSPYPVRVYGARKWVILCFSPLLLSLVECIVHMRAYLAVGMAIIGWKW